MRSQIFLHAVRSRLMKSNPNNLPVQPTRYLHCENHILLRQDDNATGVTTLTLNQPQKLNVLNWNMLNALQKEISDISKTGAIRVLIIQASGKAFCSGHDLQEVQSNTHELFTKCSQIMISIHEMPQPVIAMVHGLVTAAGCQLVATCDLAVASEDAKFGASGINVGLFCSTPAVALSRNIHRKHAMQMLLTGNFITAKEALSYGLVNKVVAPDDLQPETSKLAATIAGKSTYAVRLGKKMFYEQLQYRDLKEAYKFATEQIVCNINNYDTQRGINEFLNRPKSKPETDT